MTQLVTTLAGAFGFALICGLGFYQDRSWDRTLTSAAIAALAFGLVGQWWMRLWLASLMNAQQERAQAEMERQQQAQAEAQAAAQQEAPPA
ncbi:MAG: hypothetical protein OSB29_12755 [Verrucomicrobiota bacterium]|nr:hypothetical protein [Verrucomicrobiota bacterium]